MSYFDQAFDQAIAPGDHKSYQNIWMTQTILVARRLSVLPS
ncbi:hypothetical protein S7335_4442 [Synechococcus sp. PCC 7335]|nr:hypothetical protein [Synechococcus sp. PCC 7335]EDX86736.1 hypothetical protein S7335_4442 [Synechococcus sp. PCC 7335]